MHDMVFMSPEINKFCFSFLKTVGGNKYHIPNQHFNSFGLLNLFILSKTPVCTLDKAENIKMLTCNVIIIERT